MPTKRESATAKRHLEVDRASRNAIIHEMIARGVGLTDIARELGLTYHAVQGVARRAAARAARGLTDAGGQDTCAAAASQAAPDGPAGPSGPAAPALEAFLASRPSPRPPSVPAKQVIDAARPAAAASVADAIAARTARAASRILARVDLAAREVPIETARDLKDAAVAFGVLVDKHRLLSGQTTANVGVLGAVQIRAVAAAIDDLVSTVQTPARGTDQ